MVDNVHPTYVKIIKQMMILPCWKERGEDEEETSHWNRWI
mgnify:CR=1 FL=1